MRLLFAVCSIAAYALAMLTLVYAVGFIDNLVVPKSIDSGTVGPPLASAAVDCLLLGLFALQHSLMARPAFKRWSARFVPAPIERSFYVLMSSLALILVFAAWQPLPLPVWSIESSAGRDLVWGLSAVGWIIVVLSTFMISHFELFGLTQALSLRVDPDAPLTLTFRYLYRFVRHPIMLGFLIAFWAAPTMSQGHLLFAAMATGYILIGVSLEERDLVTVFGDRYRSYRARVPALVPWRRPRP